MAIFGLDANLV